MSAPTYWSQPNQQVVRNGDPVGIVADDPDPQTKRASAKRSTKDDAPKDDAPTKDADES